MNFKTTFSKENRLTFLYLSGKKIITPYIEVKYYGNNYILAKKLDSLYLSFLDLDGNEIIDNVIYRFKNSLLLVCKLYTIEHNSNDGHNYLSYHHSYEILNFETKSYLHLYDNSSENFQNLYHYKILQNKPNLFNIKFFLNKPIYSHKDLIFSEIFFNKYIFMADYKHLQNQTIEIKTEIKNINSLVFNILRDEKIWTIINISDTNSIKHTGKTFKEIENLLAEELESSKETYLSKSSEDYQKELSMINIWKQ